MRTIRTNFLKDEIELDNCLVNTICIEDMKTYVNFELFLNYDFLYNDIKLEIKEDDKLIDSDNFFYVSNIYNLDLNSKKNINALYKILKGLYGKSLADDIKELKDKCFKIVNDISIDFDIELVVNNDIAIDDLFKILNLRFNDDTNTIVERLIKFVEIMYELNKTDVFFINNLFDSLSDDEINSFIEKCKYLNVYIINIERYQRRRISELEKRTLYDKDFCQI